MKLVNFFIDESGFANPKQKESPCYILCGCMIRDDCRHYLKIKADQIKYKYWGREDIVFHSREIFREAGEFKLLKNSAIRDDFEKDLFTFLNRGGYEIFAVVVDKDKALKKNWNEIKVYKESTDAIVRKFVLSLLAKKCHGRLVVESATSQKDFLFHKAVGFYLSNGVKEFKVPYSDVQKWLSEVSFVTKKNHDIEEQIADLLTYGAKLKFIKKKPQEMTNYEEKILKTFESKLFYVNPNTGTFKKQFYDQINSFEIIP
ncbi:MAG: DUF3800 domain-containing protein [Patescibacteria group bacterium]|jgi:hypothetical protein